MFGLDGYAMAYGGALGVTLAVAFLIREHRCERTKGVGLLIAAWVVTLIAQRWLNNLAPIEVYAAIDVFMFFAFWRLSFWVVGATWPQLVALIHATMFFTHVIYAWRGERPEEQFAYLTILAGLGYVAMAVIVFPPLWRKAVEIFRRLIGAGSAAYVEGIDLKRFLGGHSVPASLFLKRHKAPEDGE